METPRTLIRALATNSPATPDGVPLETVEDNDLIFPACSKMTAALCTLHTPFPTPTCLGGPYEYALTRMLPRSAPLYTPHIHTAQPPPATRPPATPTTAACCSTTRPSI